jgi:hypothetical protein
MTAHPQADILNAAGHLVTKSTRAHWSLPAVDLHVISVLMRMKVTSSDQQAEIGSVDDEQEWTENRSLGHSIVDRFIFGLTPTISNALLSTTQVRGEPLQGSTTNTKRLTEFAK